MKTIKEKVPSAFVTVGKNRQKIYGGDTVYLKKGQSFELEFFNSTKNSVMAKITINGNLISDRGLVIRNGDRGYLERYIDEDRKFLFDVYTVNNNREVREAIEENGDLKVEFFKEKVKKHIPINLNLRYGDRCKTDNLYDGILRRKVSNEFSDEYSAASAICCSTDNLDFNCIDNAPEEMYRSLSTQGMAKKSKKVETGRVEKGDESGQRFNQVDMDFNSWPFHTVEYKLLPFSRQPQQLKDVKSKCLNCGAKIKNSGWKVCPICATPIGQNCNCLNCGNYMKSEWAACPFCGETL